MNIYIQILYTVSFILSPKNKKGLVNSKYHFFLGQITTSPSFLGHQSQKIEDLSCCYNICGFTNQQLRHFIDISRQQTCRGDECSRAASCALHLARSGLSQHGAKSTGRQWVLAQENSGNGKEKWFESISCFNLKGQYKIQWIDNGYVYIQCRIFLQMFPCIKTGNGELALRLHTPIYPTHSFNI